MSAVAASSGTFDFPCIIPRALQQLLLTVEARRNVNVRAFDDLYDLKAELENRWQIACSEGHTSSTMLYEILEHGWKELRRITA